MMPVILNSINELKERHTSCEQCYYGKEFIVMEDSLSFTLRLLLTIFQLIPAILSQTVLTQFSWTLIGQHTYFLTIIRTQVRLEEQQEWLLWL